MPHSPRRHGKALLGAAAAVLLCAPAAQAAAPSAKSLTEALRTKVISDESSGRAAAGSAPVCEPSPTLQVRVDGTGVIWADCMYSSEDGNPTIKITDRPDHGNLDVYTHHGYAYYAPDAGYRGPDAVKFVLTNAAGSSAELTASLDVSDAGNTAPYCYFSDGELSDEPDVGLVGHLLARKGSTRKSYGYCSDPEGDALTLKVKPGSGPASGTLASGPAVAGQRPWVEYTPDPDATPGARVQATVFAEDSRGLKSAERVIGFEVIASDANSAPFCSGSFEDPQYWDTFEIGETQTAHDPWCTDAEGDAITMTKVTDPVGATVAAGEHGLTVTPSVSTGQGTFTFKGVDSRGAESEVQTVGVNYTSAHTAPSCSAPTVAVAHATRTEFEIACSDVDADAVYLYLHGDDSRLLTRNGDMEIGEFKDDKMVVAYTPDAGFSGSDGFLTGASDRFDDAPLGKVTLNVAAAPGAGGTGGGNSGGGSTGGGSPSPPAATPEQVKAAMAAFLSKETVEFLQLVGGANRKGVDAGKAVLLLGQLGPDQLPNGGTGKFDVYDKAGKLAKMAAAKRKLLGTTKVTLAKGQSKAVEVKLNRKGKALLKKKGKVKLTVEATLTDAVTGASVKQAKSYTFKVKKKKKRK